MLPCKESDSRLRHPLHLCVCVCVARARPNSANPPQNNASVGRTRTTRRHPLHLCVCVCVSSFRIFVFARVHFTTPRPKLLVKGSQGSGTPRPLPGPSPRISLHGSMEAGCAEFEPRAPSKSICAETASHPSSSRASEGEAGRHCSLSRTERISRESPGGFR